MSPPATDEVFVVIPHKEHHELLARQIEWLDKHDYDYAVVRGYSFATACNAGADVASMRHQYILFLNDDILLPEDADPIFSLYEEARRGNYAFIDATQLLPNGELIMRGASLRYSPERNVIVPLPNKSIDKEPFFFGGAFLLANKDCFLALNGFHNGFVNGYEDLDLSVRAREADMKFTTSKDVCVTHLNEQSSNRWDFEKHNVALFDKRNTKTLLQYCMGVKHG